MILEFQIDAQGFLQAFRNTLMRNAPCSPVPFTLDRRSCAGQQVFLDRINVADASTLIRTAVDTIHVIQHVSIFLTPLGSLEASDAQPDVPCWNPTVELEFALSVTMEEGVPSFCVTFDRVRDSAAVTYVESVVLGSLIAQQFPPSCTPFDLSGLTGALGDVTTAATAGITADVALSRLAIRLELEPVAADSAAHWQSFFAGSIKPNPLAGAWSLFVEGSILVQAAVARIVAGLQGAIDADNFDLESGPSGTFLVNLPAQLFPFPGPGVAVTFSGEAIDACVCAWDEIDLDVDISLAITLSVPQPNQLRMTLVIAWDLSDFELACCAVTASVFWGFIGTNLLQEGKINWGEFLGGLAGGFAVIFTAAVTQAHDQAAEFIELGEDWVEISDTVHQLTSGVNFPNIGLGVMTLTHVVGIDNGIALSGSLGPVAPLKHAELSALKGEWIWNPEGQAGPASIAGLQSGCIGDAGRAALSVPDRQSRWGLCGHLAIRRRCRGRARPRWFSCGPGALSEEPALVRKSLACRANSGAARSRRRRGYSLTHGPKPDRRALGPGRISGTTNRHAAASKAARIHAVSSAFASATEVSLTTWLHMP